MKKIHLQNKYIQNLKETLRRNGLTQADFAEMIGFSRGLVSDVLNGKVKPSKRFVRLADSIFEQHAQSGLVAQGKRGTLGNTSDESRLPFLSWEQVASMKVGEGVGPDLASETILMLGRYNPKNFALRVEGDTMSPEFTEGEIVIVDPDAEPLSGRFVIAKTEEGTATFKQIVVDGGRTYLKPLNSRYPILDVTDGSYRVLGVIIQKMKRYL